MNGRNPNHDPQPYRGGQAHLIAMSVPDAEAKCVHLQRSTRVEFIVKSPSGPTAYTIHYGRWVTGRSGNEDVAANRLDGWLEDGTRAVTGATAGELFAVQFETHTDPVGIYIDTLTGVTTGSDPDDGFLMWVRPIP